MIRLAGRLDLPAIVDIYNEAVAHGFATGDLRPTTVGARLAWFESHTALDTPIFVYEHDGAVVGWCSVGAYRPGRGALAQTAEISYYVTYAAHGRGVGSALIRHAVAAAPHLGKRVLIAIVLEANTASVRLIEKMGFTLWGRLPGVATFGDQTTAHLYYGRQVGDEPSGPGAGQAPGPSVDS